MDDYTAAKIANVLEINPLEVIAAANAEREKHAEKREFWEKLAKMTATAAIAMPLFFGNFEEGIKSLNNNDLYIMRNLYGPRRLFTTGIRGY